MTTTVTVKALHGWPVKVTKLNKSGSIIGTSIVEKGLTEDFYVFDTQDLLIHEIQPGELET